MKIKFRHIMLLLALSVAGCAGYFSVWGLSQLFAGASTAVIIMASGLEISKVAATTALHRYWKRIAKGLKIYLTISVAVLMLITSAGIYGFLSNAYQQTANKLEIHEGELSVLTGKKSLFEKSIADNENIIANKNKRIDILTNLRNNQETRLDSAKGNRAKDKVRGDIENASKEIQKLTNDIDELNSKNSVLSDSVGKYNTKALELKAGSAVAAEVGPLKYISELTGVPMGKVVNFLILLIIFVFDPLAIALVLMTNRMFELDNDDESPKTEETVVNPIIDIKEVDKQEELNQKIENVSMSEPIMLDEQQEDEGTEPVDSIISPIETVEPVTEETKIVSDQQIEVPVYKKEPVVTTGKIELQDIKEIKENRGFSTQIPSPKSSNTIERIGSNKVVKNGDNNKLFFKRK